MRVLLFVVVVVSAAGCTRSVSLDRPDGPHADATQLQFHPDAPTADAPTADAPTADAPTADAPTADAAADAP